MESVFFSSPILMAIITKTVNWAVKAFVLATPISGPECV
jgi:hypothetical protein